MAIEGNPVWFTQLIVSSKGKILPISANIETVLRQDRAIAGKFGFDKLRRETVIRAALPWQRNGSTFPRQWVEVDDIQCAIWLQRNDLMVEAPLVRKVVETVAHETAFHPVLEYLAGLSWDGEPRLDEWPIRYLGCPDSEYARAVGARWMISAVARVMQPGCKVDCALVLEGNQGIGKSKLLRRLGEPWFTDEISALGTKDAAEQTIGVWIIELSEMDAVVRAADIAHVKAFMSRPTDRFRKSYGHRVEEYPRQCVFAASVNHQNWNRDDTGARRWWPLVCERADFDAIVEARDQLWAEAKDRYIAGEVWWLDAPELVDAAAEEQSGRTVEDPWLEPIRQELASTLGDITTQKLLTAIGMPKDRQGKGDSMRVAALLKRLGYLPKKVRQGDAVVMVYERR